MATQRDNLEIEKLRSEINKMIAETAEINQRRWWYPIVVVTGVFAVALGVIKLIG